MENQTNNMTAKQMKQKLSALKHPSNFSRSQLTVFVLAFALIGGYLLYRSFAAGPLVATLEAEQMVLPSGGSVVTDSTASAGKAIQLLSNGTATGSVSFPGSVTSITVNARGDQCSGAPLMTVSIDGNAVLSNASVASTAWSSYSVTPPNEFNAGTHTVSASFTNDYNYAGKSHGNSGKTTSACDRNLYIDVTNFYGPDVVTPAPTVTLSASPTSVTAGSASTLTWNSTNATSCTASGAWSGTEPTSGNVSTGALNQNSTYTLTCTGAGGSTSASATVTVTGGISWTFCAKEYSTCSFSGTKDVRYGANGSYVIKTLTGGTLCDNSVFGDPAVGYDKECDTADTSGSGTTGEIPKHIETWAYDGAGGGGVDEATSTSGATVRQWTTYAEGIPTNSKAVTDCHGGTPSCAALAYLDTNLIYTVASCGSGCSVPIWNSAQENWWLHQPGYSDSSHRLTFTAGTHIANRLNPNISAIDSWFKSYMDTTGNGYDGLFMDDVTATLSDTVYGSGFSSSQEETTDAQVQAGHEQLAGMLTHSDGTPFIQVNNGVQAQAFLRQMPAFQQVSGSKNVIGLVSEDSSVNHGAMLPQLYYGTLVDMMGYVDHTNYFLNLLGEASDGAAHWRRVQEGTVLLGYSPGRIVDWANLETSSANLAVWPEEGIYPTQPVQTMSAPTGTGCLNGSGSLCTAGGHNDVQVAPGVYRREFTACYNQGTLFGRCATIVNSTTSSITIQSSWLSQSYGHQITFNGGDVQSGGSVNLSGAGFTAGSTVAPAQDSLLLAQ